LKANLGNFSFSNKQSSIKEDVHSLITTIKGGLAITTTRAGAHVSTVRASAFGFTSPAKSAAGSAVKASVAGTRATSSSAPPKPAASKQQVATAMPFSKLMDGFRAPAAVAQPAPGKTMRFPEMIGGVATGRRLEVHVPSSATPKIDAAATARKVIAAGERAATGDKSRGALPANSAAARIIAAGERARSGK
jgi:hypothetical protein